MILTDDADRANYIGCEPFGPHEGYDPMYDDAPGDGPKCGGCETERGCRHCSPPDAECIATGFEIWERPDFYRLRNELSMLAAVGYALHPGYAADRDTPGRLYLERTIGFNRRLYRAAVRKLDIICGDAETHADALEQYAAWAKRAREIITRKESHP